MKIIRKLFVVPLADNDHGKTTMMRALVSQGLGRNFGKLPKGTRELITPSGRTIDAYVYGRSFQEIEKKQHPYVETALTADSPDWRLKDLIIMPSHISDIESTTGIDDVTQMIEAAHGAGFDAICALISHNHNVELQQKELKCILCKQWDERWNVHNPRNNDFKGQLDALGRDLWFHIASALNP